MQMDRGTPRTLKHQLACTDVMSKSLPALCTSCTYFWSRTWSHTIPWRNSLSFWCLMCVTSFFFALPVDMALCTSSLCCVSRCKMRRVKKVFKQTVIISTSEKPLLFKTPITPLIAQIQYYPPALRMIQDCVSSTKLVSQSAACYVQRRWKRLQCISMRAHLSFLFCIFLC